MRPNGPDANLGVAKISMSEHEPEKAAPYLKRAAKLEPFDATTHCRLGVLYRELGHSEDAHRELADFEKLKKVKNRLNEIYQAISLQPKMHDETEPELPK